MSRTLYYRILFGLLLAVTIYRYYVYFNIPNPAWGWYMESIVVIGVVLFELYTSPRWLILIAIGLAMLFVTGIIFRLHQWPFGYPIILLGSASIFLIPAIRAMYFKQYRVISLVLSLWIFFHWLVFAFAIYHHEAWRTFYLVKLLLLPVILTALYVHLRREKNLARLN